MRGDARGASGVEVQGGVWGRIAGRQRLDLGLGLEIAVEQNARTRESGVLIDNTSSRSATTRIPAPKLRRKSIME